MVSRTKKTVLVYVMMIVASLPETTSQLVSKNLQQANYPVNTGIVSPSSKGYYSPQLQGGYYNHPVDAAYWTGHYPQYPHYQPMYQNHQYQQYNPYQYQQPYYHQPYGYAHHPTGYAQSYGHYPSFDPMYWSMAQYPRQGYYPNYRQQMYYQTHPAYYPGGQYMYPAHGGGYYAYPGKHPLYRKKPFGAGFLTGNKHGLVKGVLGAVLVGAIAKKVVNG